MPVRRSRAIKLPPIPQASIGWHAPLFTTKEVQLIAEQVKAIDQKIGMKNDVDASSIASALNYAFHDAIVSSVMLDRLWQYDPAWFTRLGRDVRRLLDTLGLEPAQCTTMAVPLPSDQALPAIYHLREAARVMPLDFWPPAELVGILCDRQTHKQRAGEAEVTKETEASTQGGESIPDPGEKVMADVILQLLPRILGLVLLLSEACEATTPKRPPGAGSDILRRELFNRLVEIHVAMYGRGPWSRNKASERRGGSIKWARLILETARDRLAEACGQGLPTQNEQIVCIPALVELASRENDTLADWLEQAWSRRRSAILTP